MPNTRYTAAAIKSSYIGYRGSNIYGKNLRHSLGAMGRNSRKSVFGHEGSGQLEEIFEGNRSESSSYYNPR